MEGGCACPGWGGRAAVALYQYSERTLSENHRLSRGTIRSPVAAHGCWTCFLPFSLLCPSLASCSPCSFCLSLCKHKIPVASRFRVECRCLIGWKCPRRIKKPEEYVSLSVLGVVLLWNPAVLSNDCTFPKDTGGAGYENESTATFHYHILSQCEHICTGWIVHQLEELSIPVIRVCLHWSREGRLCGVALEDARLPCLILDWGTRRRPIARTEQTRRGQRERRDEEAEEMWVFPKASQTATTFFSSSCSLSLPSSTKQQRGSTQNTLH